MHWLLLSSVMVVRKCMLDYVESVMMPEISVLSKRSTKSFKVSKFNYYHGLKPILIVPCVFFLLSYFGRLQHVLFNQT